MNVSAAVRAPKALCESLSSEQLEVICNLDFGKTKPKKRYHSPNTRILSDEDYLLACEWQFYALLELIGRLEYGFNQTATSAWTALHYRNKAKKLRNIAREIKATKEERDAWYHQWFHLIDNIKNPPNTFFNTATYESVVLQKTGYRLLGVRGNRTFIHITGISKGFLPSWFPYLGGENLIELTAEPIAIARVMYKGKRAVKTEVDYLNLTEDEKKALLASKIAEDELQKRKEQIIELDARASKVSHSERFFANLFRGARFSRLINGLVWASINLSSLILILALGMTGTISLPLLGFITIAAITASLSLSGAVFDILNDLTTSLYEFFNFKSLLKEIKSHSDKPAFLNKNILNFTKHELAIKCEESLITRTLRLFGFNTNLGIAMLLIVAPTLMIPVTAPLAVLLLSACATYSLFADVIPSQTLASNYNNRVDKVRSLVAFGFLLVAIGMGIAMMLGAPFITIPMIGGVVALTIGTTGLARRIARIDTAWVKDKFTDLKEKTIDWFKCKFGLKPDAVEPDLKVEIENEVENPDLNSSTVENTTANSSVISFLKETGATLSRSSSSSSVSSLGSVAFEGSVRSSTSVVPPPLAASTPVPPSTPHQRTESAPKPLSISTDAPALHHRSESASPRIEGSESASPRTVRPTTLPTKPPITPVPGAGSHSTSLLSF